MPHQSVKNVNQSTEGALSRGGVGGWKTEDGSGGVACVVFCSVMGLGGDFIWPARGGRALHT